MSQVLRDGFRFVWMADGPSGERYAALLDTGDEAEKGISGAAHTTNLWSDKEVKTWGSELHAVITPHRAALF